MFLHDHNGPKGGVDKVCRVLVKARRGDMIVAAVADTDWTNAVDRATSRMGRNVARQIIRRRDKHVALLRSPDRLPEPMQGA